jgi:hypothetical protein
VNLRTLVILFLACSCAGNQPAQLTVEEQYPNRLYFSINSSTNKIIVPVHLNDSIVANLMFDTGVAAGLILDSTFFFTYCPLPHVQPVKFQADFSLVGTILSGLTYHINTLAKIGQTIERYDSLSVLNLQKVLNNIPVNGIFSIPTTDTSHVWELNFENNYLEIHPAEDFQLPAACILSPIVEAYHEKYCMQIPLQLIYGNDTLQTDGVYIIDTGNFYNDVILTPPAEAIDFLNGYDNDIWFAFGKNGIQRNIVQAIAWNDFAIDTLHLYTFYQREGFRNIGINFLKRFNVFFDLRKRQIGLQPIKYARLAQFSEVFHYSIDSRPTQAGNYRINSMGDYKTNYYRTAGLQVGDEIVSVNGIPYKNYKKTMHGEITYSDLPAQSNFLIYEIIRSGKRIMIAVPNIRR